MEITKEEEKIYEITLKEIKEKFKIKDDVIAFFSDYRDVLILTARKKG